jgi:hypothetical protein
MTMTRYEKITWKIKYGIVWGVLRVLLFLIYLFGSAIVKCGERMKKDWKSQENKLLEKKIRRNFPP